jgi:energy-coupling factor transporter ATP-binding protein EcfA2
VDEVVEAVLLTGPPGSGKTAIAKEISEVLWRASEPHAVIELDELCRGVLPAGTADFNHQLAVDNLRSVWTNFAALGVRRLVLSRIIQTDEEISRYAQTIPGIKLSVCRIRATPETIDSRICHREPGSSQAFLRRVSPEIAARMEGLGSISFEAHNDNCRQIADVASEILGRLGWLSRVDEAHA